ncbi:MAG: leucyl aminopeptidase family protein [Bdellovibrionaceae bacterium]|nr:leucyl aminopeptidase family protein [Pseudobdellovibrionaceae bacterium]
MNVITSSSIIQAIQAGIQFSNEIQKDKKAKNKIYVFSRPQKSSVLKHLKSQLYDWQWQDLEESNFKAKQIFQVENGFIYYLPLHLEIEKKYAPKQLHISSWGTARDKMGAIFSSVDLSRPTEISFIDCTREQMLAALLGVGLASYMYKVKAQKPKTIFLNYFGKKLTDKDLNKISAEYSAVNLARHLVNLPAGDLNPTSYVKLIKTLFKDVNVNVLNPEQLKKEGMGLMLGVGGGAQNGPFLVHLSFRKAAKSQKPIAFIGKGVTFDSGGLNIKPAENMRLMKKDMGGSASLLGVAYYLMLSKEKVNCDFYLAIAENAISSNSFRPGDVLHSRKGLTVEIHNTDAEGRLILADALNYAVTQKETPRALIDVATLTGAVKQGLGANLPGLFCSEENLQSQLLSSAKKSGEFIWPLPLDPQQELALTSNVADLVNCTDGFGGAVKAALFLQRFTEDLPWAHFDIYAWNDSPRGALREKGGSGQIVQSLLKFLGVSG